MAKILNPYSGNKVLYKGKGRTKDRNLDLYEDPKELKARQKQIDAWKLDKEVAKKLEQDKQRQAQLEKAKAAKLEKHKEKQRALSAKRLAAQRAREEKLEKPDN
jgi:hypothetical protein